MPSKRNRHGEYVPLIEILDKDLYAHIRIMIMDEFKKIVGEEG